MKPRHDSIIADFHNVLADSLVASKYSAQVNCTNFLLGNTRPQSVSDAYTDFRVLQLRFRLLPGVAAPMSVGYISGLPVTFPGTNQDVDQIIPSIHLNQTQVAPTDWVRVSPRELHGQYDWYHTQESATEIGGPGFIVLAGSGTNAFVLEIFARIEFQGGVSTVDTPLERTLLAQLARERAAVAARRARDLALRALSGVPGSITPGGEGRNL